MSNPVLVRDSFNLGKWYAYVPADKDGRYWTRYDLAVPGQDMTNHSKYFCIQQVLFGKVFPGQIVNVKRDNATLWVEAAGGYWSDTSSTLGAWIGRTNYSGTLTAGYATVTIPATHNKIKILVDAFYTNGSSHADVMCLGWDDTTNWATASKDGLDQTEIDLGTGYGAAHNIVDITVTVNAAPGTRKLRIWRKNATPNCPVRIFGIRSWNTRAAGDPSTAASGIATGHDMIDTIANSNSSGIIDVRNADQDCIVLTNYSAAHEFAILNGPPAATAAIQSIAASTKTIVVAGDVTACYAAGQIFTVSGVSDARNSQVLTVASSSYSTPNTSIVVTGTVYDQAGAAGIVSKLKYTGGAAHFNDASGSYEYNYAGGTYTDGPTLLAGVSATALGGMGTDGVTVNPKGTLYTAAELHIRSVGYPANWSSGTSPKITWTYTIDATGISFNINIEAAAANGVDFGFSGGQYGPMWPVKCLTTTTPTGYWKIRFDTTRYKFPLADLEADVTKDGANWIEIYYDGWPIKVRCLTTGPTYEAFYWNYSSHAQRNKLYCWMWPGNWGTTLNDSVYQMAASGSCSFGGRYEISFLDPAFNAGGYRSRY